jgi:hypothetical protein
MDITFLGMQNRRACAYSHGQEPEVWMTYDEGACKVGGVEKDARYAVMAPS